MDVRCDPIRRRSDLKFETRRYPSDNLACQTDTRCISATLWTVEHDLLSSTSGASRWTAIMSSTRGISRDATAPSLKAAVEGLRTQWPILETLIGGLPEDYREASIFRDSEKLEYREIAGVSNAAIGTVMSTLAWARRALRRGWPQRTEGNSPCRVVNPCAYRHISMPRSMCECP